MMKDILRKTFVAGYAFRAGIAKAKFDVASKMTAEEEFEIWYKEQFKEVQ